MWKKIFLNTYILIKKRVSSFERGHKHTRKRKHYFKKKSYCLRVVLFFLLPCFKFLIRTTF
jgi:hypothetical protein